MLVASLLKYLLVLLVLHFPSSKTFTQSTCIKNDVLSNFEVKYPRKNEVLKNRKMNLEIEVNVYSLESFNLAKDNLLLCVSNNLSDKTVCYDDGLLTPKDYILKQSKNQTLSVAVCQKVGIAFSDAVAVGGADSINIDTDSVSAASENAGLQCLCTYKVDVVPQYAPSCIDNDLLDRPFLENSYSNVLYSTKNNNKYDKEEYKVDIYFPLVEYDASVGFLDDRRLSSIQSMFQSIQSFKHIIEEGGISLGQAAASFTIDVNIVISSVDSKSLSPRGQILIEFLQKQLLAQVPGVDRSYVYICPNGISECIIPTILNNYKNCSMCGEDSNIVIVADPNKHKYSKEAIHDMVDVILEAEPCFAFFSSDSIDAHKMIKDGSLFHYTVGRGRRPTRWAELPEGFSGVSPAMARGDAFVDDARDFSAKLETIQYYSEMLNVKRGPGEASSEVVKANSIDNLVRLAHSTKNRFGQRIASLIYPWPSSGVRFDEN